MRIEPETHELRTGELLTIRSAESEDASSLVDIMYAAAREGGYMVAEYDELTVTEEKQREEITEYGSGVGRTYLVAEVNGEVVGFCECESGHRRRTAHTAMLSIFVKEGWRNKGVGRMLLRTLVEWAEADPLIEKLTLAVFSTNKRAINVYKKAGFKVEGKCLKDVKLADGTYVDSVMMYKFMK